jgi:hypothetical protein
VTPLVYALSIAFAAAALGLVLDLLRRGRLRERHAIWWIVAGLLALTIAIFPQLLDWMAAAVGAEVPTNLVFFVSIALLFGVCVQLSAELTLHEAKLRVLAEHVASLQLSIDDLSRAPGSGLSGDAQDVGDGTDRGTGSDRDD